MCHQISLFDPNKYSNSPDYFLHHNELTAKPPEPPPLPPWRTIDDDTINIGAQYLVDLAREKMRIGRIKYGPVFTSDVDAEADQELADLINYHTFKKLESYYHLEIFWEILEVPDDQPIPSHLRQKVLGALCRPHPEPTRKPV